jgi:CDP-glucose 4,6-dehydratase
MELGRAESLLRNRRVLVTGHTGFTGTWIQIWLDLIGANYYGLSLENTEKYSMRKVIKLRPQKEFIGNVADSSFVFKVFEEVQPELVLHLAAQPIVSLAYKNPFETITTNTQGTAVVLEAVRKTPSVQSIVCVTTDKVYKNLERGNRFVESDELGGSDPYASSKSAAEDVILAYRQVFDDCKRRIRLNVARGGNIVGGGDYSIDRIVPDLVKSIVEKKSVSIRQPNSTRPWQHVLSLVHGYILLLAKDIDADFSTYETWNFGPIINQEMRVSEIVSIFEKNWQLPKV